MTRRWFLWLWLLGALLGVAGCAPAATPPTGSTAPEPTAQPWATGLPSFTEAPAPTAASAEGDLSAAPTRPAAEEITTTPAPAATQGAATVEPPPEQTVGPRMVQSEPRVLELEYPLNLSLASSTDVRLSLVPDQGAYEVVQEQADGTVITRSVEIPMPVGYGIFAGAQLLGVNFDIAPTDEQFLRVNPGETLTWRWTVRPQSAGDHTLTVNLRLRLISATDTREQQVFSRAVSVRVWPFPGPPWVYMGLGILGLATGGAVSFGALLWRGRGRAPERRPNLALQLDLPGGLSLERDDELLLRRLFADYQRLIVEREFRSGYSGARALLALPVKADGRADAHTIVKLGPIADIAREHANYERFVKNTLPPMTARMQDAPLQHNARAALRYTFVAEPGQKPVSLRQALRQNLDPAPLVRLFETFAPNWWAQTRPLAFRLAAEYDRVLPPQAVLEPVTTAPAGATVFGPESDPRALVRDQVVRVTRFPVVSPRADGRTLSLSAPATQGRAPVRLSWLAAQPPNGAPVGARVVSLREDILRERVASVDLGGLPDPIARIPEFLDATIIGGSSIIHGDLNLENALVGPGGLIWLIDFAETREGHVLYDFARLGAEVVAHVLAPAAGSPEAFLATWRRDRSDPTTLTGVLFALPARLRADSQTVGEYELCLLVACLGALKHDNLDALARACLYLAAADLAARRP